MGFFDGIKKRNKEKTDIQTKNEPLVLNYSDGVKMEVNFQGLVSVACEDTQKIVHQASITTIDTNGKFNVKQYLLEPIQYTNENGETIDGTEMYYKQLGRIPQQGEDRSQYNAVKGFFKGEYLNILESNYIGNLARMEDGQYIRNYDSAFKAKYDILYKQQQEEQRRQREEKHIRNENNINTKTQEEMENGFLQSLQEQTIPPEQRKSMGEVEVLTSQRREEVEKGIF